MRPGVRVFESPVPCLAGAENFMQVRQAQLENFQRLEDGPNYVAIWDDDHILEAPGEARRFMQREWDLIYCRKRFVWDKLTHYNAAFPEHKSVFLFKNREQDAFAPDRMLHAPCPLHDEGTKVTMNSHLLDIGYLWPHERERVFRAYAQAGKIDPATLAIMQPPELKRLKNRRGGPNYWDRQLREHLYPNEPDAR